MKTRFNLRLTAAVSAVVMLSGMSSVSASELQVAESQPTEALLMHRASDSMYIVRLADPAIATYEGGISGYPATSAKATGKKRLNTNSKAAKKYQKRLERKQGEVLAQASKSFGRSLTTKYDYQHAINGFAVSLTPAEAKALGSMAGVIAVQQERNEHLLTDSGPAWIGAPDLWSNGGNSTQGEGMVVAVLDTGINSDHPSFADIGGDGYNHTNPLGSGNYLPGSHCDVVDASFCNDKLIGAWDMTGPADGPTPEDTDGHGSHTASTAAGNVVVGATLDAPTTSVSFDVSGVAPHANIIAYDVCTDGCPGAALVAAINQVVIDSGNLPNGIASLNYSISGGGDPYNDTVELGFLAAVEAGIYVSASAGNSGPAASTVAHLGPWVATTAASTHNRQIRNSVTSLSSDGGNTPDITGLGFTSGYGPAPIINSADLESTFPGSTLCGVGASGVGNTAPWPPGTFNGEIVACTRGAYGRVEKGINVLSAGAGGYILMDNGGGLVGDAHVLPGVHISQADGAILGPWITANAANNPMATISGYNVDLSASNGDVMAGFSSRGPQLAFDVLKPDVTAPGVDIFAAEANGQAASVPEYQFLSGTSMSSPHNAGAGALLTAAQPSWTPQEIKSALMLTSTTANTVKEDGVTPTDPFDLGAGRIVLGDAENSGLVMNESIANFLAADPSTGGDPSTLNVASMMDSNCVGTCSWTRTVTNKTKHTNHYDVTVSGVGFDTEVTVSPQANGANNLKVKSGQSATITVTATNYDSAVGWQFGTLNLASNGNSGPDLHMPMAVFASKASNPDLFTKTVDADTAAAGDTLTYELSVTNGQVAGPITISDVIPAGASFVAGSETESVVNGTTSAPWAYNAGTNSLEWTGELDAGGLALSLDPGGSVAGGFLPLALFGISPLPLTCNGDCDDGGFLFNVPAYTFNGQTYTQTLFSVNGTLEAGTASGQFSSFANQNLPDASLPNNILAPFWRDLNLSAGGSMSIGRLSVGCGIVTAYEWNAVPHFGSTDTVSMQVWIGEDGGCVEGLIHYTYGPMDNTSVGGTVGVENETGTVGASHFYNGTGSAPVIGDEILVQNLNGGSANLGFQVETDCSEDLIINEADLSNADTNEVAIAVTSCQ